MPPDGRLVTEGPPGTMEIGHRASWTVTTAKPGNGVELMRDDQTATYWQSDGHQPHLIDIKFDRKMHITELQLFLDFKQDESYTPQRISIRAGSAYSDLKEVISKEFHEPQGWQKISFQALKSIEIHDPPTVFKAKLLQIAVQSNHQNGRDTHVRQVKVYGQRRESHESLTGMLYNPKAKQLNKATTPVASSQSETDSAERTPTV